MIKKGLYIAFVMLILSHLSYGQNWLFDIEQANQQAQKESKPIVLVFQGSDWCAPCMKLDQDIWSSSVFKEYASTHYVMLKADFPKRSKNKLSQEQQEKNNLLAEKYNTQGFFPLVVILDNNLNVLGSFGYQKMEPQAYIDLINSKLSN